jgi:hypothetical protein
MLRAEGRASDHGLPGGEGLRMAYVLNLDGYRDENGKFNYAEYRRVQEKANIRKLDRVFASRVGIAMVSGYLRCLLGQEIRFGLCHGTRRGMEQAWFMDCLGCEVLGTEISSTATQFPHTIQWDFHEVKPEWVEAVDFIYSNSWDHSFDPERCFRAWASCLRVGGVMVLEHSNQHSPDSVNKVDPFGIDLDALALMLNELGGAHFGVRDILALDDRGEGGSTHRVLARRFVVVEKRRSMR